MSIIFRLIRESLGRINVKISFLWDREHGVFAEASFAVIFAPCFLRIDIQIFTSVISCMSIIYVAQKLSGADYEILRCSGAVTRRNKPFKP